MSIDVFAADEQQAHPVDLARWATMAREVLTARGVKGETEVSLLFVDEDAIAAQRAVPRQTRPDRRPVVPD